MNNFTIDFFELLFLAEVCIPPKPIARSMFWSSLIDVHYHKMTHLQRSQMYKELLPQLNLENDDCRLFKARFDPNNQYKVYIKGSGKSYPCFLYKGEYYIQTNTYVENSKIRALEQLIEKDKW